MKSYSFKILNVLLASASTNAFLSSSTALGLSCQQHRKLERPGTSCHPSLILKSPMQMPQIKARRNIRNSSTRLRYASSLPDSSDPCVILNIQPGSVDLKEIKRAYRQLALKFHPDTRAGNDATEAEHLMPACVELFIATQYSSGSPLHKA